MNNIMKKALTGLASGWPCAAFGTPAFPDQRRPEFTVPDLPECLAAMEVLWQDNDAETDTINWGTDTTYSGGTAQSTEYNQSPPTHLGISTRIQLPDCRPTRNTTTRLSTRTAGAWTGSFMTAPAPTRPM